MGGVSSHGEHGEHGEHGRRAQREQPPARTPVGPVLGWVVFALLVGAGVLLMTGIAVRTVLALLAAGALVGGVLVAAVRFSPPVGDSDATAGGGGPS